jgi:hypothetical protein
MKEQDYLAEAYEIGRKGLRGKVMNMLKRSDAVWSGITTSSCKLVAACILSKLLL